MIKSGLIIALCGLASLGGSEEPISPGIIIAGENLTQMKPEDRLKDIDAIVNKALETFKVPGAAVGVVVDGKVVFSKGYGKRDIEKDLPVTENTLFAIGSCTKAVTTNVLGQLVDEGLIAWDDPVIDYLPEFRLKDEHATHHLTIRDLVTHRSGMPRHDLVWYNTDFPRAELLARMQHLEFSSDLREKFQYNNLMYTVAGIVIEKVTGQTWEEAVRERVLNLLKMNHSNFSVVDSQMSDDFSLPYMEKEEKVELTPFRKITNVGPAGSINSSIEDMTKWLMAQLVEGKSLVKKTTLQEMHTLQVPISSYPNESVYSFGYGLGWFIGVHNGHYCVSHGGGIDGFISFVAFLPHEGVGVVVLCNNGTNGISFVDAVKNTVLDRLIDAKEVDWVAKMDEKRAQVKDAIKKTEVATEKGSCPSPFEHYVGKYEHPAYGVVRLYLEEGFLKGEYNQFNFNLKHKNYDSFNGEVDFILEKFPFQFSRTPSGDVSEVHIPFEAAVEPIIFKKKPNDDLLAVDYLKKFSGVYEGAGTSLEVELKGNQLTLTVVGQPTFDLVAEKPFLFALKGVPGSSAEFVANGEGVVDELIVNSPYGRISFKKP